MVALTFVTTASQSEPASAAPGVDSPVPLPLSRVTDMVVDDAHGHLFFAGGEGQNGILVTDFAGNVVTTIAQQESPMGLALSPDGSRLYAGLYDGHAVSEIDTATLTETRRFPVGQSMCPEYVAPTNARVWFTYGCGLADGLGSVDVSGTDPVVRTDYVPDQNARQLISIGGSRLALADASGGGYLRTFDVRDGNVTPLAAKNISYLWDVQVTPDGQHVLTAGGGSSTYDEQAWQTSDLSPAESYATDGYGTAGALSEDGSTVAAGTYNTTGPDVWVYALGESTPRRTVDFGMNGSGTPYRLAQGQLAFSADGTRLFAVTTTGTNPDPALWVMHDPTKDVSTITVNAPPKANRGQQVTVTGQLSFEHTGPSAPYSLQVERKDRDGTHPLPDVTTAADGSYSFSEAPREGGPSTYTVTFQGDATTWPSSGSDATLLPTVPWDVNGDDVADLVTGAPGRDVGKAKIANAGAFSVLDGGPSGVTGTGARTLSQNTKGMPDTAEAGDRFGSPSASGDFNADGYADVVVSAPREDYQSSPDTGLVQILYGSPSGLTTKGSDVIDASDVGTAGTNYSIGASVAVGDFEGDGYGDLAIGAPTAGSGEVLLYRGTPSGLVPAYKDKITQGDSYIGTGGTEFGYALATGDANGDGRDDLAIGVPGPGSEPGGYVVLIYGDPNYGIITPLAHRYSKGSNGVPGEPAPYGSDEPDSFGKSLAFDDYNGDGFDDLAISAPGSPVSTAGGAQEDAGTVTVMPGSSDGLTPGYLVTQQTAGVPDVAEAGDQYGAALAAGDTTGDGTAELAVTSLGDQSVTVLVGSNGTLGSQADKEWSQSTKGVPGTVQAKDRFGASLRIAPFNASGASSLAVGVPGEDSGKGRVLLLYSNGTGLTTNGVSSLTMDTTGVPGVAAAGDQFGSFS